MKLLGRLSILMIISIVGYGQGTVNDADRAIQLLKQVSGNLRELKHFQYIQKRELNYSSENYHHNSSWQVYGDFQSSDTVLGFRFQVSDEKFMTVFNGVEKFELDKTAKTINVDPQPVQEAFSSSSFFYNSLITLRRILPLLIADKQLQCILVDTIISDKSFHLLKLNLQKKRIRNLGNGFDQMTTASNLIYFLVVDKTSKLPVMVIQGNDRNSDYIRTDFIALNSASVSPDELSWYYSTYTGEFKTPGKKEMPVLVRAGAMAPDFILPGYKGTGNFSLEQFAGKVLLLDFWIKNCGPCIRSIPFLNALQEKYAPGNFEIIGINSYDNETDIDWFCTRHKPAYRILMKGKSIAEKYGVDGFPTYVLVGRDGKVVYAGNQINELGLEKMVESALNRAQ